MEKRLCLIFANFCNYEICNPQKIKDVDVRIDVRSLIVSVIQLLEEKKIKKSDFIITENYHTRLGEDVAKLSIEKINSNFNARYNYKNKIILHTIRCIPVGQTQHSIHVQQLTSFLSTD